MRKTTPLPTVTRGKDRKCHSLILTKAQPSVPLSSYFLPVHGRGGRAPSSGATASAGAARSPAGTKGPSLTGLGAALTSDSHVSSVARVG